MSQARCYRVALVGNPNTGKSTVFNRLTGLRQRTVNYPGTTVFAHSGKTFIDDLEIEFTDLPGTYSLSPASEDERVVFNALLGKNQSKFDLILFILDSTNLRRNLLLVLQVAELGLPSILVLNHWDQAQRNQIKIDIEILKSRLGVPVIPMIARKGWGLNQLQRAIADSLRNPSFLPKLPWLPEIEDCRTMIQTASEELPTPLSAAESLRLVFDAQLLTAEMLGLKESNPTLERIARLQVASRERLRQLGLQPTIAEATLLYRKIDELLQNAVQSDGHIARSDSPLDSILLHPVWGIVIFFGLMFLIFQTLYSWASPIMDAIESLTGWLQAQGEVLLTAMPTLQSLVCNGIIAGVGGVLVFLPQILLLFLFISLLEESGYLARAAFLMDKALAWCGLNGKSFVPLLSGYACAIPAILSTRTLDHPCARLTTILMTPFMSCSARLPVYTLFIGAFIEPAYGSTIAGITLFLMHVLGPAVALPLSWFFNRKILRIAHQPFLLEFPAYNLPAVRNVLLRMWESGRDFVLRAGTIILSISILLWAALYFPRPPEIAENAKNAALNRLGSSASAEEIAAQLQDPTSELSQQIERAIHSAYLEQSYLGRIGKFLQPVFAPAGFDWKLTVAILGSFPAREVVISTLGIIYNLGGEIEATSNDLRQALHEARWNTGPRQGQPIFTIPVAIAVMVFIALCLQCGATVAVIAQELNWKWAVGLFATMSLMAWIGAVVAYQSLSLFFDFFIQK